MDLGFFTQPIHNDGRGIRETLKEDRMIFQLAESLGYVEAFVGEHITTQQETVPNGLLFLASLADVTSTIRLGTAMHALTYSHPVVVASNVAWLDHLLEGRFLFGIGGGSTYSDVEAFGLLQTDRRAMLDEAISHVLALWNGEPPYDLTGEFWDISTARTRWPELGLGEFAKPCQNPHPPILFGSGEAGSTRLPTYAQRGWSMLSSDTLPATRLAEQWANFEVGQTDAGVHPGRRNWRVVRAIFVAEDEKTALQYGNKSPDSPFRAHYHEYLLKFQKGKLLDVVKADPADPDEAVTLDYMLDNCVITGTPGQVTERILKIRESCGPFGTLVYAGKNWTDPKLSRRSMELMAEEVMPAVNAAIGPESWELVGDEAAAPA